MGKFGSGASVNETFKVEIIDPATDLPLKEADTQDGQGKVIPGRVAFIEVLSTDSDVGRAFDKTRRKVGMQRAIRTNNSAAAQDDPVDENQEKLSKLTRSWFLIDVTTMEAIDVPCNEVNALELYRDGGMQWLFRQVWLGASSAANFIKKESKPSSVTPSGISGSNASATTEQPNANT